jgi:hypothetical protein
MKTTTLPSKNSISCAPCRLALLLIPLALACFALSPIVRAVSPPPDGGYPGNNTAEGTDALFSLSSGLNNTALGFDALYKTTTGGQNTATGCEALFNNTTGGVNVAVGYQALYNNNIGGENTAVGYHALFANTTSILNTGIGSFALSENTDGTYNAALGSHALYWNTTGYSNTAVGHGSAALNTTGVNNTAVGAFAFSENTIGYLNTAIGTNALYQNTSGNNNIAVGASAGSLVGTGSDNIHIGSEGANSDARTIRIGTRGTQSKTFIAGIHGATTPVGVPVYINSSGKLGTTTSSARFKEAIKPMDKASEAILGLKPVTFHYKQELDPEGIPQFGLVAEEVEKVNPDLVARDDHGKPYTVRYEAVNAMLLNEFLKEHRTVEKQQATIAQLKAADAKQEEKISALTELVKAQAAQIQKVSAQLEVNKTASQIVLNNQ